MPIYAYRCSDCGFQKDFLQKVSDPVLTECPECHKATLGKLLTAPGFQLKGNGWYATDFKGGSTTSAPKEGDESKSETKTSDSGSSESKSTESSAGHSCGSGACATCS